MKILLILISSTSLSIGEGKGAWSFHDVDTKEYHRTVNEIFFKTWAKGFFVFTPQDSLTLYNIALQDPLLCGRAIYDARVMLNIDINDYSIGQSLHSMQFMTDSTNLRGSKLYPNPSNDKSIFEIELYNDENGTLEIIDLHGKILNIFKLNPGYNNISISTDKLPPGMYALKVRIRDEMIEIKKLIIQR